MEMSEKELKLAAVDVPPRQWTKKLRMSERKENIFPLRNKTVELFNRACLSIPIDFFPIQMGSTPATSSRLVLPSGVWLPLEETVVPRLCRTRIRNPAVSRCGKASSSSYSLRGRCAASSSMVASGKSSTAGAPKTFEAEIERVVYSCRFMTLLGVSGSLVGSLLCFIKGCTHVAQSFAEYNVNRGKVIVWLVEAIDVYLLGTVMLVFGMGLYELFVCNLDIAKTLSEGGDRRTSNLFGLFTLKERPKWLEIKSVDELKTKLGHVIVMLLLIGLFDKSKKAAIHTPVDLLCFSASVLLSSGCLYLLSKLNGPGHKKFR